jgi:uncharacterized protein (DUF924 family)
MSEISAGDVVTFWFEDIDPSCWFRKDEVFDRGLEERFGDLLALAKSDRLNHWCNTPEGCLALIILLDQFPRNIYRDSFVAFESDPRALELTLGGIETGLDKELSLEQRSFFYLPLRHAEDLAMQELGLKKTRELNKAGYGTDKYALNHLELIKRFGRFPHRNSTLGRSNTEEEAQYLSEGTAGF